MIEDIIGLIKAKLESDTVLGAYGNPPAKVRCVAMGANLKTDPVPPYIRICVTPGYANGYNTGLVVEIEVVHPDLAVRSRLYKRVYKSLQRQHLSKTGLKVVGLWQVSVTDNVPDRKSGGVKLAAVYQGLAVLTQAALQ